MHALDQLTRSAAKAAAYGVDTYFREGLRSWTAAGESPWPYALVVLKPDAVAGRRLVTAVTALRELGFVPAGVAEHRFSRHSARALWQYQLNQATLDRLLVIDRLLPACPSLILLMRDDDPADNLPAAVRLSSVKGPAEPAQRRPEHLRHRLRAGPTLFNFLHSADEPADVVRELGILVADEERGRMIEAAAAGADETANAISQAARLHDLVPGHDLDLDASVHRLRGAASREPPERAAALLRLLSQAPLDWRLLEDALRYYGVSCDPWDIITIAVYYIEHSIPGVPPLIADVEPAAWMGSSICERQR